jgi:FixJ family two-component response regulator
MKEQREAQSIVFVVDDDASMRDAIRSKLVPIRPDIKVQG